MLNLYEIFITYIMPYFVDLGAYPWATEGFYYAFCALSALIVLTLFIIIPFGFILNIARGGSKRRSRGRTRL